MAGGLTRTKIEWATHTINPVTGCSPVSEGCEKCYAKRMAPRLGGRHGYPKEQPFKITFHPNRLEDIKKYKSPDRVFVGSMTDLWHGGVPPLWRALIFERIRESAATFMVLTKRPEQIFEDLDNTMLQHYYGIPNLWIGVTAENQIRADERIPFLLQIPAAIRFVSVEPMLKPVDLTSYLTDLNWIICGAETGPGKREMSLAWANDLAKQCKEGGVPFFFKKDSRGLGPEPGHWRETP